ncbi:MAG: hypothetical protein AMS15_08010 [Planctomycetes bacterium DG_23]|nr:MAG: hypothetical protein AMS15_08010 [Planctomycetes bacterium DG_23]
MTDRLQLFAGNSNPALAGRISEYLDIPVSQATVDRFPDGEVRIKVEDDVRGSDAFLLQSVCHPVNENLVELLIFIDCLKRASADRITPVIPYFGYARQDRKDEGRVPISAKLVADLITAAGADRVLTIDLHSTQIQGFFNIPVDHLLGSPVLVNHYQNMNIEDLVVVAPDVGKSLLVSTYARKMGAAFAIVDQRRVSAETAEVLAVVGEVEGMNILILDDIISTAGKLAQAVKVLKERGARDIYVAATHPVLAGNAAERILSAPIKKVAVTDTIPVRDERLKDKVEVVSVGELLGEAIRRIHENLSVSSLFD